MALTIGATFAGYRIIRPLGSGGMGEVYLAEHPRLPRLDAVKILRADISADRDFRERFHREADSAARLFHPHIVGVHDLGEHEGQLWIAMDYVDGADTAQLIRRRYPAGMPLDEALPIVFGIASALDHAHGRGLLHRDVKPANILLGDGTLEDRRVMLADFGIARSLTEISGLTATNMALGTIDYAAPEQLMGGVVDGRADQYSLAATAFHLLTGAPPYRHCSPAVTISRHLGGEPPEIGSARPDLAGLDTPLRLALSREAARRFPSCRQFAQALAGEHTCGKLIAGDVRPTLLSPRRVFAQPIPEPPIPMPLPVATKRPASVAAAAGTLGILAAMAALGTVLTAGEPSSTGASTLPANTTVSTATATATRTTTTTATAAAPPHTTTVTATLTAPAPIDAAAGSADPAGSSGNAVASLGWSACMRIYGPTRCRESARDAADAPFGAPATFAGDGMWSIPATVGHGEYRSAVGPLGACFWSGYDARGRLVDSGMAARNGVRVQATITPTMRTFHSHGCTPWFRITSSR